MEWIGCQHVIRSFIKGEAQQTEVDGRTNTVGERHILTSTLIMETSSIVAKPLTVRVRKPLAFVIAVQVSRVVMDVPVFSTYLHFAVNKRHFLVNKCTFDLDSNAWQTISLRLCRPLVVHKV
jgi:hypothetical protein